MRRGETTEPPRPTPVADHRELSRLSPRERQVLSLAAAGHLDKQIAVLLGVTLNTLRTYWTRIRGKLGETSRSALAALYAADEASAGPLNPIEGANWHIDIERQTLVFYGERDLFPHGEIPLEQAITLYHAEDREKVGELLQEVQTRDMPPFNFAARVITSYGVEVASAYVETVRDETGKIVRVVGRHVPFFNLTGNGSRGVQVGGYRRDLDTGEVMADEGFRSLFRIQPDETDLIQAGSSRICPEHVGTLRKAVALMVERGEGSRVLSARLCFEGGDRLWITLKVRLELQGGRPKALIVTVVGYD